MRSVLDHKLRVVVFDYLNRQAALHGDVLPWSLLLQGVEYDGRRWPLVTQRGIWRPRALEYPLSIITSPNNPYGDAFGSDRQLIYHYFERDPLHPDNVGLRDAMRDRIPLVYLHGVAKGRYVAVWPVFVRGEDQARCSFFVEADDSNLMTERYRVYRADWNTSFDSDEEANARRRYTTREVRQRLHQRSFRERVLAAYGTRCAVCRLRHERLLDAAHIIADTEETGDPVVRKGLSLCKLHHAAFDANVFGIRPDCVIDVRPDVHREHDGPMLQHGIQGIHGQRIHVPNALDKRPDPERLEERYRHFKTAG